MSVFRCLESKIHTHAKKRMVTVSLCKKETVQLKRKQIKSIHKIRKKNKRKKLMEEGYEKRKMRNGLKKNDTR